MTRPRPVDRPRPRPARASFTLVEVMVAGAILVALLLPALDTGTRSQQFFVASEEEAAHQARCQLLVEHMVRVLRHARRFDAVVPGDRVDFRDTGPDGAARDGRFQVIALPPIPGELPASEVRFAPRREDPASEVVVARNVRLGFAPEEEGSTRRLRLWAEAEPVREVAGAPASAAPFRLETTIWRRPRRHLLRVGAPRVEVTP